MSYPPKLTPIGFLYIASQFRVQQRGILILLVTVQALSFGNALGIALLNALVDFAKKAFG